ncbi:DUF3467 domain-containing protein [Flavobacteriaceae bacterium]|nr:DUF3467 domain-containing protein [Flavobacteriaceae bacterium]MDB3862567.1 DUF3467 domain-containing protein [Flavobacteriaceae bacterium]MDC3354633.1 DUF3467 domain-containing protein [Flavobacteriaceae bacterium]
MSDKKAPKEKQLNIAIDENIADGIYSNLAIINHSTSEFIVDFITVMPGAPKARVKSRVILTPEHAKRFQKALAENIQRFENVNGIIETNEPPPIPLNFGPTGEA